MQLKAVPLIYTLTLEPLMALERMGEKSAKNLLEAILLRLSLQNSFCMPSLCSNNVQKS